jgi:hypothetical protein
MADWTRRWRERNREVYNARRRVDPYPPRTCATCGQVFTPVRHDKRYCRRCVVQHRHLARLGTDPREWRRGPGVHFRRARLTQPMNVKWFDGLGHLSVSPVTELDLDPNGRGWQAPEAIGSGASIRLEVWEPHLPEGPAGHQLLRRTGHIEPRARYRPRQLVDYSYVIHDLQLNAWVLAYRELLGEVLIEWHGETPIHPPPKRRRSQLALSRDWTAAGLQDQAARPVFPDGVLEIKRPDGHPPRTFLLEHDRTRTVDKNYDSSDGTTATSPPGTKTPAARDWATKTRPTCSSLPRLRATRPVHGRRRPRTNRLPLAPQRPRPTPVPWASTHPLRH